jgi:hypothetical protein
MNDDPLIQYESTLRDPLDKAVIHEVNVLFATDDAPWDGLIRKLCGRLELERKVVSGALRRAREWMKARGGNK